MFVVRSEGIPAVCFCLFFGHDPRAFSVHLGKSPLCDGSHEIALCEIGVFAFFHFYGFIIAEILYSPAGIPQ